MNGMETAKTDDIQKGSDEEYYVEHVVKMRVKDGRDEFFVNGLVTL